MRPPLTMVWEQEERELTTCCICARKVAPEDRHLQRRPTGMNGRIQRWAFCLPCWSDHKRICRDRKRVDGERLKSLAKYLEEAA